MLDDSIIAVPGQFRTDCGIGNERGVGGVFQILNEMKGIRPYERPAGYSMIATG